MTSTIKLFLILIISTFLFSDNFQSFTLDSKESNKVVISFQNKEIETSIDKGYKKFINAQTLTIDDGMPELPKYTLNYGLDPSKEYEVSYNIISSYSVDNIDIYPHQSAKRISESEGDDLYVAELIKDYQDVYPENIILEKKSLLRGNEILSLDVVPFSYDRRSKSLEVFQEIEINIEEVGDKENYISKNQ